MLNIDLASEANMQSMRGCGLHVVTCTGGKIIFNIFYRTLTRVVKKNIYKTRVA